MADGSGVELDDRIGIVTNLIRSADEGRRAFARLSATADRFLGLRLTSAGGVRVEAAAGAAVRRRRPLVVHKRRCAGSKDVRGVARWVEAACGEPV